MIAKEVFTTDKYLAEMAVTTVQQCMDMCTHWSQRCQGVCVDLVACGLNEAVPFNDHYRLIETCGKPCGGFNLIGGTSCTLYPPNTTLLTGGSAMHYSRLCKDAGEVAQDIQEESDATLWAMPFWLFVILVLCCCGCFYSWARRQQLNVDKRNMLDRLALVSVDEGAEADTWLD